MKTTLRIFSSTFCFFTCHVLMAQWVQIPDVNFRNYLSTHFPGCMNGEMMNTQCPGIQNATTINLNNLFGTNNVANLTGIEHFTSLITLHLSNMGSVQAIAAFPPNLQNLIISFDENFSALPPLPSTLLHVSIYGGNFGPIETLPPGLLSFRMNESNITSVASFPPNLNFIDLSDNYLLTSIAPLPQGIITLRLESNSLSSLPQLPATLQELAIVSNQLVAVPELPEGLLKLKVGGNTVSTLPTLPEGLTHLEFWGQNFTAVPTFPNSIQYLTIGYQSTSIQGISAWPESLINLEVSYTTINGPLPTLPQNVTKAVLYSCGITSIASLPNGLQELTVAHNQLTTLPAIPESLYYLDCTVNQITCMPYLPTSLSSSGWGSNYGLYTENNPLTCVANYLDGGSEGYLWNFPICAAFDTENNPLGCDGTDGIFGRTFNDTGANCTYSNGVPAFNNVPVKLYNNGGALMGQMNSYQTGLFSFYPDYGNYTLQIDTVNKPYRVTCTNPGISQPVATTSGNGLSQNNHFALECKPGFDIGIQAIARAGWVFPGQWHELMLNVGDMSNWYGGNCAAGTSAELTVVIDGPLLDLDFDSSVIQPISIQGNVLTFSTADVALWNEQIVLLVRTDTTAQAGDEFCISTFITPVSTDLNPDNNSMSHCYMVINSYDPNMKEVYPVNVLPGYEDHFTYTIHFQNTGNAPAFNIRLQDTLSALLDLNSFEVTAASHPFTMTLNGQVLRFFFNDIMLPDSTSNEAESKGYVQYRIRPIAGLPDGSAIYNTAYIYFDYNDPIITNTTANNFAEPLGVYKPRTPLQFAVYPNPSTTGIYQVRLQGADQATVSVYNIMGQRIQRQQYMGSLMQIDLSDLGSGVYLIQVEHAGNIGTRRIVKN